MPLIKTGGGVTQITGSIAGNTFFRNRSGSVMRTRTVPTNTRTAIQVISRELLSKLDSAWYTTLTATQRESWSLYARNVSMKNKLGEVVNLTGQLHFIRSNQARMTAGLPLIGTAPSSPYALAEQDPLFLPYASSSIQLIAFYFNTLLPWVSENSAGMIVHVGKPINKTRNYYNGPWKFLGCILGSAGTPPSSPSYLESLPCTIAPGQKVFFKVQICRADGRLSTPSIFSTEVSELALPFTPFMQDNFNSYADGALNGQGSWSGPVVFLVDGTLPYEGAKGVRIADGGINDILKPCTSKVSSQVSCYIRKDTSKGNAGTYQSIFTKDNAANIVSEIGMFGQDIKYYSNLSLVTLLSNYSLATWYNVQMVWRGPPDYKCKYRVDNGEWTAWVTRGNPGSIGPTTQTLLESWGLLGGGVAYFDYIH